MYVADESAAYIVHVQLAGDHMRKQIYSSTRSRFCGHDGNACDDQQQKQYTKCRDDNFCCALHHKSGPKLNSSCMGLSFLLKARAK